jgi:hypothetical protein
VTADGGTSAEILDLANDLSCRSGVTAFAMQIAALVVHDHGGPMPGERQSVRAAKTTPRSRDDGDPTVKISIAHSDWAPNPFFFSNFHFAGKFPLC